MKERLLLQAAFFSKCMFPPILLFFAIFQLFISIFKAYDVYFCSIAG
jgi:hypothetical protein